MKYAESTGISRRRLLAMASVSAGGALFAPRPLFADRGRVETAIANPTANPKNTAFASLKQLTTDFLGEDRHEFVAKLAYTLREGRDRPFGSPEVDWFAAEQALYSSLVASGSVTPSPNAAQHIAERLYW